MYALMMEKGVFSIAALGVTFIMMILARNMSGGHFNPAITCGVMVSDWKKENLSTGCLMIVAQFVGSFAGIFLGWMSLVNYTVMDDDVTGEVRKASVPDSWIGIIAPSLPSGNPDLGDAPGTDEEGFTRDWQTFWAMLITSIVLSYAYVSIKNDKTQLSDEPLV